MAVSMTQDLVNSVKVVQSIVPIMGNNTTEGTGLTVDTKGYESAVVVVQIGVSGDTLSGSVKILASMEESNDDSAWSAVAAADLIASTFALVDDAAEDAVIQEAGYRGAKRYIRPLLTFTGTHTVGTPISAMAVLGHARHMPV